MDRNLWRGALVLTIAAFVVKILSAFYRLPYQNLAGDIGFYVYQQVYPFYALAVTMGGFGFPVAFSKLIAEGASSPRREDVDSVFSTAVITLGTMGILLFLCLFGGAPILAGMMEDPRLVVPIRTVAFIFLWVPFLAVFRGYFQGAKVDMVPTGLSQVGEQSLRVAMILGLSLVLFFNHNGPYAFGTAAAFGSMVAPLASVSILFFFYRKEGHGARPRIRAKWDKRIAKRLLSEGLAYTLASLALVAFQFVDAMTIVPLLDGHEAAPRALKGIYDRSYPLIQLGMTAAVALATAMVPIIARLRQAEAVDMVSGHIRQALRIGVLFGCAATIGLITIIRETNIFLFEDGAGSSALAVMGVNILSISLVVTGSCLLQGLGRTWLPVLYLVLACFVKLGLNIALVPSLGILGAAIATAIGTIGLSVLIIGRLKAMCGVVLFHWGERLKLILSLVAMFVLILAWKSLIEVVFLDSSINRISAGMVAVSSVILGAMVFLYLIVKLGLLSKQELEQLPGGKRLTQFGENSRRKTH